MNKLYSLAFKRILASLSAQEIKPTNLQLILSTNKIKPMGSFIYHRLPRQQVRALVKNPCPVQNVQSVQNKELIKASKSIRASFSIQEQKVCNRCPHKQKCPEFAKPGQQNNINAISDLLLYMQALNQKSNLNDQVQLRVLTSGYKACDSILATLQDLKQGGHETLQYQRIRLQHATEKQQLKIKESTQNSDKNTIKKQQLQPKQKKPKREKPQNAQQAKELNQPNIENMKRKITQRQKVTRQKFKENQQQEFKPQYTSKKNLKINETKQFNRFEIMPQEEDQFSSRSQRGNKRPNKFNQYKQQRLQRNQYGRNRQFPEYNQYDRQNQYNKKRYQSDNNRDFSQRKQKYYPLQRQEQPRKRLTKYERQYQNKPRQSVKSKYGQTNEFKKYRSHLEPTRAQELYTQRRHHKKSMQKLAQQQMNLEKRFEKAGEPFSKSKVVKNWSEEDEQFMKSPRAKEYQQRTKFKQSTIQRFQKQDIKVQTQPQVQRRGRRIKK